MLARVGAAGAVVTSGVGVFGSQSAVADTSLSVLSTYTTQKGLVVKAIASQSANLTEWQNSAGTVLASVTASGNLLAQAITTPSNLARIVEVNSGGILQLKKATASQVPGATDFARFFIVAGTTTDTLKLVMRAGVTGVETTIVDNIDTTGSDTSTLGVKFIDGGTA
jgi:hypothetical protein